MKIIFDLVHGYIEIDPNIEMLINSESFQRLKFINQLTAQHLYPSANHTRFEHSLGVMKLAMSFFEKLQPELKKIIDKEGKGNELINDGIDNIEFLKSHLQYAALLHDVGHAPLSHVGEHFLNKEGIRIKIKEEIKKNNFPDTWDCFEKNGSPHEVMSCYVILRKFKIIMDKICNNIDYGFIFRIIIGAKYKKKEYPHRNVIISIVNSESFDVDKLDYLMRDNFMTGKVGPEIDIVRLLRAAIINNDNALAFSHAALSALQKVIDCRDNLYMWVYNHHTVVYTDYLYQECFKHFNNLYKLEQDTNEKYNESAPLNRLFSCEAIAEECVDDNGALHYIKEAMRFVKKGESKSKYTKNIVTRLENRNYLKPTWKTLFEYTQYLEQIKSEFDTKKQDKIIKNVTKNEDNRKKLVKYICGKLNIELGNLFIVDRKNNFYCEKMEDIYITINGREEKISSLLPPRDYKKLYDGVAFYIFCEESRIEDVKKEFIKYYRENIDEI